MTINDLYRNKQQIWYQAEDIVKVAEGENRMLNADEETRWNKLMDEMNSIDENIKIQKKADQLRSLNADMVPGADKPVSKEETQVKYTSAQDKWIRTGNQYLTADERKLLGLDIIEGRPSIELRTINPQTVSTTAGGYIIPTDLAPWIERASKYYGPMLQASTVWVTSDGRPITWPSIDDTSNTGSMETINSDMVDNNAALTFGQFTFNAYKYSSDAVVVPYELLQDTTFNLTELIGSLLGERLYRKLNTDFTTADGSSKPVGIIGSAGAYLGENAAATAITRTDLVRLIHSVDPSYRMSPKAAFMFADSTLRYCKLLTIGTGDDRPLWEVSMIEGQPNRIEGYPYWVNNDMAAIAATAKPVLFGDFGKFVIRQAGPIRVVRLTERYAEKDQVAFLVIGRWDSEILKANTTTLCPIKYLRNLGT